MAAWIIAQHEVLKLFGTRRGWLSLLAFALVWGILYAFVIEPAARLLSNQETTGLIGLLLGDQAGRVINNWRTLEVSLYWLVALYTMPFFAILMSADQIASGRSRGTLRYLTLRCSRLTLYFSRFAGQLVIMALLVAVTYVGSIAMSALHDVERAQQMLPDAPAVMINVWLVLMPYVALMSLLSVLARSSRQATVFSVVLWIGVWLAIRFVQNRFDSATWLSYADWIMPGAQIRGLLSLSDWETLQLAPIPLAHTVVLLLIGAVFMWKRDL